MYYQVHHILVHYIVHYIVHYDRVFLSDMIMICSITAYITGVKERLSPGVDYSAIDYH